MHYEHIHLKDLYPNLNNNGADPILEVMVQNKYRPTDTFLRPSLIICPGGGYEFTWDGEGQPVAFEFLSVGFNCFVLRYSVKPNVFPQAIAEIACTIDYIKKNAEIFNADVTKTAIIGFSAGGHVAASYCTLRNHAKLLEIVPNPESVEAALLCYPVISAEQPTHSLSFKNLTGHNEITDEDINDFSLEKHVSKELTPPTFIWTNSDDNCVNPKNSLKYASALTEKGIPYELHVFPKGGHGVTTGKFATVSDSTEAHVKHFSVWTDLAKKWLADIFDI